MKRNFKGFTLVECLVAMAILAIACMTLGAIEASVAQTNKNNHFMNTSLSNQMKYIEEYTNSETVPMLYGGAATPDTDAPTPPHKHITGTANKYPDTFVKIETVDSSGNKTYPYSYAVDIYVMYSRDRSDGQLSNDAGYTEKNNNLRYKYLLGH